MSGPLVSVVIPACNAQRFISRTLDSVFAQTCRDLEIIVVDDGSADGTADIVREKAAADPRLKLIRQANAGVAAARNRAIAEARGQFIAPLDADDLWHREKIERQLRRFEERPQAGLVYCWSAGIDENDLILPEPVTPTSYEGDVFAAAVFQDIIGNASVPLIRRDCLEAVGGFDERLRAVGAEGCEDRKLCLDLAERYDFALVPLFLVGYRQVPQSMSRDHERMRRSYDLVMAEARRRRPDIPDPVFRWAIARSRFSLALCAASNGEYGAALSLCCAALRHDPMLVVGRWFRRAALRGLLKAAGGGRQAKSVPFHEAPIDRSTASPSWAVRRQRRYVQSMRMRERAAFPKLRELYASRGSQASAGGSILQANPGETK